MVAATHGARDMVADIANRLEKLGEKRKADELRGKLLQSKPVSRGNKV
jgi:hypothetical protein